MKALLYHTKGDEAMKQRKDTPKETNDALLVEMFWSRNESAIAETDSTYGKYLYAVGASILTDKRDIEECKNDALLAAWNAIPPERPAVLLTFLSKLMRRISISRYRALSAKKNQATSLTLAETELLSLTDGRTVADEYGEAELSQLIASFVRALPERERYIFVGRFYMSQSVQSLARELGVNIATVYRDIGRIKEALKAYLEKHEVFI